ncbi:DNase I-like protein, partial [Hymenopellis radicata]
KAAINVSCLNIRGFSFQGSGESIQNSKWAHVNQLLRRTRTGILVVSEAHLTQDRCDNLENLFGRRMKIHFTPDPVEPKRRAGVAIVVNKQLAMWHHIETRVPVPGRAMLLRTRWYGEKNITVLGIYAPNVTASDARESIEFYRTLYNWFVLNPSWWPDYMGGDTNFVEDPVDRLPMRSEHADLLSAFDDLKELLHLRDGWRATFPDRKQYSHEGVTTTKDPVTGELRSHPHQARLDRIYVTNPLFENARQWKIAPTGIAGLDHDMVSVQVAHEDAPVLGRDKWACPDKILKDRKFVAGNKALGLSLQSELEEIRQEGRSNERNAQRAYHGFITKAMELAKERERIVKSQGQLKQTKIEKKIETLSSNTNLDQIERSKQLSQLKTDLKNLKKTEHDTERNFVAARNRLEGETVSRYYFQANKVSKPRDIIHALEVPESLNPTEQNEHEQRGFDNDQPLDPQPKYEKYSPKMADIMREYHGDTLQNDGLDSDEIEREATMDSILGKISVKPSEENKASFEKKLTREQVLKPLRLSKNESAPGLNGASNKYFKSANDRFVEDKRNDRPAFDIVGALLDVFNDIEEFGVDETTNFAEGWMCPIYKKNDRNKMSNYRPITLLNCDYKLFTKALSIKL